MDTMWVYTIKHLIVKVSCGIVDQFIVIKLMLILFAFLQGSVLKIQKIHYLRFWGIQYLGYSKSSSFITHPVSNFSAIL